MITNIGESHIEYLGSREGIAKAKLEIVSGLKDGGALIIDGDEPLLAHVHSKVFHILSCGYNEGADLQITDVHERMDGYTFSLNHESGAYRVPVLGRHNVKNAVYSIAVGEQLGLSTAKIKEGIEQLKLTKMRFELVDGQNGSLLINDCYNASPTSMKAALETLKTLPPRFERRIAVLGDMYELGRDEEMLHKQVADAIGAPITHIVTIGSKGKWIADALRLAGSGLMIHSFETKATALPFLRTLLDDKTVMLFKASRLLELEKLVEELRTKGRD
ncbi:UDP-N-acetylmuramoyl-tripeptide--D-alanyl-D-alanine ligase [Terrilactibacillus sp. S3-3]|nr:UDP-N-acetylmuramoyl-tripeptide--D-alanyl-D-alanine ligase [Terrilactibacillus sp. S3-3]